jgi:hypothetical protein
VAVIVHNAELVVGLVLDVKGLEGGWGGGVQAEADIVHDVYKMLANR